MPTYKHSPAGLVKFTQYRVDTLNGSPSAATVIVPDSGKVIAGSIITADLLGKGTPFYGAAGTYYLKELGYNGVATGTVVTSTGTVVADVASQGSSGSGASAGVPDSLAAALNATFLAVDGNLGGLADAAAARSNLGLGAAATKSMAQVASDSALTAAFNPLLTQGGVRWAASTAVVAGAAMISPKGDAILRKTSGTTRANFDATEAAAWTTLSRGAAVNVRDFGAVGDGTTDDTAAILAAVSAANTLRRSVFAPAGVYLITSTIELGAVGLQGEGPMIEGGSTGGATQFKAGTADMTMIRVGSLSRSGNFSVQGNNIARFGMVVHGTRALVEHVTVYRCAKSGWLLPVTQNSTFINCTAQYSARAWTLANGARNNKFFGCDADNIEGFYGIAGVPWANTVLWYFVIDTADADYGSFVTTGGNDRNNWFAGISENSPCCLKFANLSAFSGQEAANNQWYGHEMTATTILDTTAAVKLGELLMDSCSYITDTQSTPMGAGTLGQVVFQGVPFFSGANNVTKRGWTQPSNYGSLWSIDSDRLVPVLVSEGGGTYSWDATARTVTLTSGNSVQGVSFRASSLGNIAAGGAPNGETYQVTFTISTITGGNPVKVYIPQNSTPFRRLLADISTPGTYTYPVRMKTPDGMGVSFACNGNTNVVIEGVVMRAGR